MSAQDAVVNKQKNTVKNKNKNKNKNKEKRIRNNLNSKQHLA